MKQRTIKFRAWDNGQMCYEPDEECGISGKLNDEFREIGGRFFMQFTGLMDKNEKEIYEADLIEHPQYPTPLRVEWDYDQWGLFDGICNEASIDEGCEVVGNIFEK